MKSPRTLTCLIFAATFLLPAAACAEQPGSTWLAQPQLIQKLDAQGFKLAKALKAVRGHWEGEAFQNGEIVVFHANAQTGQVTFEKAKDNFGHDH